MRALISVSNHDNLVAFASTLISRSFEIISTGVTAQHLKDAHVPCQTVMEITGFNESLDGRLTMFHPRIMAGIIADRQDDSHRVRLARQKIEPIDLVVVNLAPFSAIDSIDAGRISLIQVASLNFGSVATIVDPADYSEVAEEIKALYSVTQPTRLRLASKALYISSEWTSRVARYFRKQVEAARQTESALH